MTRPARSHSQLAAAAFAVLLAGLPAAAHDAPKAGKPENGKAGRGRHHAHADQSFADVEFFAGLFENPSRNEWQKPDEVLKALKIGSGMTVADVGAGTGYFSVRFASAVAPGGTVFASDLEPNMVRYLRDRADKERIPNLVPVLSSKDDPRLPDRASDLVFICDTWHHIQDPVAYARRLKSDLAQGGKVVIVDFVPGEIGFGPPPEAKVSPEEVKAEFLEAGYRLVESPGFLEYQYILVFEPEGAEPKP